MKILATLALLLAVGCQSPKGRIDPDCLIEDGLTAKEVTELRHEWFVDAFALKDSTFAAEKFKPGPNYTGMAYYPLSGTRAQEVEFRAGVVVGTWIVKQRKE